jgi:hypothetical protein
VEQRALVTVKDRDRLRARLAVIPMANRLTVHELVENVFVHIPETAPRLAEYLHDGKIGLNNPGSNFRIKEQ